MNARPWVGATIGVLLGIAVAEHYGRAHGWGFFVALAIAAFFGAGIAEGGNGGGPFGG